MYPDLRVFVLNVFCGFRFVAAYSCRYKVESEEELLRTAVSVLSNDLC
jgi:hypothetical protein